MAKVNVKVRFDVREELERIMDAEAKKQLGEMVVSEAKQMIAQGTSPVRGQRRFQAYKDRKKYPGDLKPGRPVNLNLTGEMLDNLGYKDAGKNSLKFGMVTGSQDVKDRAKYHNEGTENMAKRQFIPQQGEEFAVTIARKIRDFFQQRLAITIKNSYKK